MSQMQGGWTQSIWVSYKKAKVNLAEHEHEEEEKEPIFDEEPEEEHFDANCGAENIVIRLVITMKEDD